MQYQSFLIKYAEIGTKGKNRYMFEDALIKQIRYALKSVEGQFDVTKESGRIYVKAETDYDYDDAVEALKRVFGIADICPMAAREIYTDHQQKVEYITGLKDYMTDRMASLPGVTVNSRKGMESAPQIVSASFQGVRSEVLLHALEDKGIYVSSGSACSSNHPAISGTLKAIGVRQELLDSTLRFSFGVFNTREEIDYCMEVLEELLPVLRRYHRG